MKILLGFWRQGIDFYIVYRNNCNIFRWRLFRKPIIAKPENVVKFTKAAVSLHNFLRTEESSMYCPAGYADEEDGHGNVVPGAWRSDGGGANTGLSPIGSVGGNRYLFCFCLMIK